MKAVYGLDCEDQVDVSEGGGKGLSLIQMTRAGLTVPEGCILSVDFFALWIAELRGSPAWDRLVYPDDAEIGRITGELKTLAGELILSSEQRGIIDSALREARIGDNLWAVRSSSPEEDLEEASFAGGYATVLGVTPDTLEQAIRHCFISALDERIVVSKKEHGFPTGNPGIAVIVQRMLPCDKAGVAFTINPLNNSYDEVAISANFGLGETVVSGTVTPDFYSFDTAKQEPVERKIGKREFSLWLNSRGGVDRKENRPSHDPCLLPEELRNIAGIARKVEAQFGKPMDIEWGMVSGIIYLLQARPITAYFRLSEAMLTGPGERSKLYMDFTLVGQGIHSPFSVMGEDGFARMQDEYMGATFGKKVQGREDGLFFVQDGRAFFNISFFLKIFGGRTVLPGSTRKPSLRRRTGYTNRCTACTRIRTACWTLQIN